MEKVISSEKKFDGRLINLRVDNIVTEKGVATTREVVEHRGAVVIVAITDDNELVLVRQYRHPAGEKLLEVPAGTLAKGEKPEAAAQRELREETGYQARVVKKIWAGYVAPGYSTELIQFFLAQKMTYTGQQTDEDEQIEVELIDIEACFGLLINGKIKDNKTAVAILLADLHLRGEL